MLEKNTFTDKRLEQLRFKPELIDVERWGEYCYIPLDIPRYDYPELVSWYFDRAKTIYKLKSDIANPEYGMTNFDSVDVFLNNEQKDHIWSTNPQQDFLKLFPNLIDRIYNDFPVKSIGTLRFWSSNKAVPWHRDHTKFVDYPSSFRIMLYDQNPVPTLQLSECLPDQSHDPRTEFPVSKIADTNSFAWNNLRLKHGSFFIPNFRKIILIIDRYDLDVDKYKALLQRSVEKYKNYIMHSKKNLNDFINL
jgi:hypothetical protein